MTEYITMKPMTLAFKTKEVEENYIYEHKKRFQPRFRPLLFAISICMLLLMIPDIMAHHVNRVIIKIVAASICFITGVFAQPVRSYCTYYYFRLQVRSFVMIQC